MSLKRVRKTGCLYVSKRFWYHVSTTLTKKELMLVPWGNSKGFNRSEGEPEGKRICVAPTIEQCITAIPYTLSMECTIYRTKEKVKAISPHGIFDMNITNEGWLQEPTVFVKIGTLDFEDIEKSLKVENVISQAASLGRPTYSGRVLRWWKKARIRRFIKSP